MVNRNISILLIFGILIVSLSFVSAGFSEDFVDLFKPQKPLLAPNCGDAILDTGESCDDGNLVDGDGCSRSCQIESGWICDGVPYSEICGDGILTEGEECDDFNVVNGDGCSSLCMVEHDTNRGLIAHHTFESGSLLDASGNGNDGTPIGGLDCSGNIGAIGDGCTFANGSEQYVDLGALNGMDEFRGSIVAWAYPTGIGSNRYVYAGAGTQPNSRYYLQWDNGNFRAVRWGSSISLGSPELNKWHHLVLTWDENRVVKGYINGELKGEKIDASINDSGLAGQKIGAQGPGLEFIGSIDEVRIYDRVLTQTEINELANVLIEEELTCGNGIIESGEQCDDGNLVDGDGCSRSCQIEVAGICGDGVINLGEQCDDSNGISGDGCDAFCNVELGYNCIGQPSSCTFTEIPETCQGCESNGECLAYGERANNNYCSFDGIVSSQKVAEETCVSNFECESNVCTEGQCLALAEELREQASLIRVLFCWVRHPISENFRQACILDVTETENIGLMPSGESFAFGSYPFAYGESFCGDDLGEYPVTTNDVTRCCAFEGSKIENEVCVQDDGRSEDSYVEWEIIYNNDTSLESGNLSIITFDSTLYQFKDEINQPENGYIARVLDSSNKVLNEQTFQFEFAIIEYGEECFTDVNGTLVFDLTKCDPRTRYYLETPCYTDADEINVFGNDNSLLLEKNIVGLC